MDNQAALSKEPLIRLGHILLLVAPGFLGGIALALLVLHSSLREGPTVPANQISVTAEAPSPLAHDHDMRLGEAALRAGRPLEAVKRFDAAHRRHPKQPEPLLARARVFLTFRQVQDALASSRQACHVAPDNATCHVVLGQALEAAGDSEKAAESYARAQKLDPKDPKPPYHLGRLAHARLQAEVAIGYYRQALVADPGFAPAAHNLASQLQEAGRFDEAEQLLTASLERKPEETRLRMNLAQKTWLRLNLAHTYLRKGDAEQAVREFQTVLSRVPEMAEPHYHLGCALVLLGRDAEAAEAFQQALTYDPNLPEAWYALAQLRKRHGEDGEAKHAFTKFSEARDLTSRIRDLKSQIGLNPEDVEALVELGAAQLERGKPTEASHSFQRAIQLDPDNERARGLWQQAFNELSNTRLGQQAAPTP